MKTQQSFINSFLDELIAGGRNLVEAVQYKYHDHPNLKISFEAIETDTGLSFQMDRVRLKRAICNLLNNAIKYSYGADTVLVRVTNEQNYVHISVQDFGIGIPPQQQSQVFQRFFRVANEKENTYAGLGLGLYISSVIIKRHKGKLSVESEPGKGSLFSFKIPYLQNS